MGGRDDDRTAAGVPPGDLEIDEEGYLGPDADEAPPDEEWDGGVDPSYARLTAAGLEEAAERERLEQERRRASEPPPDLRSPQEKVEQLRDGAGSAFLF